MAIERGKRGESMQGVLFLHSETGTEGGYWAFQDERFIKPSTVEYCKPCGNFGYVPEDQARGFGGARDFRGNLEVQQGWVDSWEEGRAEREAEVKRCLEQLGFALERPAPCKPGHHRWELFSPDGHWDYDGLHILRDGDLLTILDKANKELEVWSGRIDLQQFPLFTQDASGIWIHADQKGISRDVWSNWFFNRNPARLVPGR